MQLTPVSSSSRLPLSSPAIPASAPAAGRFAVMLTFNFSEIFPWHPLPRASSASITSWSEVRRLALNSSKSAIVIGSGKENPFDSLTPMQKAAAIDFLVDTYVRHRQNMPFNRMTTRDKRFVLKGANDYEVQKHFNLMLVEGSVSCLAFPIFVNALRRITHLVVSYISINAFAFVQLHDH